jgi:hypothetical protein
MSGSITSTGTAALGTAPFAADSVFNQPLGSGAQWQANAQLSSANAFINTTASGFNENVYAGSASDPLITVTNNGDSGGQAGTFQVHIPAGAVPASGGDSTLAVDDTTSSTWYSFGGFNWTGTDTATVSQASSEPFNGSGITQDGSNFDEGVGTLLESDLQSGSINHMLRMELPTDMLQSYSQTSTNQLAPYAWPQTEEDGFAINGNGGPAYSGTVPYGVTIGIPAGTPEPAAVAGNAGANMLWQELQDHGAMVRDSGGSGNSVIFQADQNVNPNDPLIQGMDQFSSQIMAATQILTNQGPNSINGGGTPIVPLNGSNGASAATPTTPTATAAVTPTATPTTPTATAAATPAATPTPTPASGGTTSGTDSSSTGASATGATTTPSTTGDTATITPATLSSGQSSSGSSSGMAFVSSPSTSTAAAGTTDPASGTSGSGLAATDPATSSATGSAGLGAATSSSDFTPPAATSSGSSYWHQQNGGSGAGHGAWWATQQAQAGMPAHHG